jgi:putative flippase GtrA
MALMNSLETKEATSPNKVVRPRADDITLKRPRVQTPPFVPKKSVLAVRYPVLYNKIDSLTAGRADEVVRATLFLIMGGSAALLNLICVALLNRVLDPRRFIFLISMIATEASLIFNFVLNDRFTFSSLIDGRRSYLQRCLRFHGPAMFGFFLTTILSTTIYHVAYPHLHPVMSQAIAIVFVLPVNFTFHRFWTFRPAQNTPIKKQVRSRSRPRSR